MLRRFNTIDEHFASFLLLVSESFSERLCVNADAARLR